MNRTYMRALSVAFGLTAASMSFAQGWVWFCDDPTTTAPLYSIGTYGGNGVGNELFAATMPVGGTATYEVCWPSAFNGNGAGGLDFNLGTLGSMQTTDDEFTELIFGGGFSVGLDFDNNLVYSPGGSAADWMYGATVRQATPGANPTITRFGSSAIDTFYFGASDRYMVALSTQDSIRVQLRVDSVGDAARVQWDLTNQTAGGSNIGFWFGQHVFPIDNFASNPKPITLVNAPGYKPLTVNRRFQRTPDASATDPVQYPLPDYLDFMVSQNRAWEGLHLVLSPTDDNGAFPDQTAVDGLDFGLPGFLLGGQPGNDGKFPDAVFNDFSVEPTQTAYIQKWNPLPVQGNTAPVNQRRVTIVSYYKTTWGDSDFGKPYGVVIDSPKVIGVSNSDPYTFVRSPGTLRVYIDNIRGYTTAEQSIDISNARITLTLPQGMGDANDLTRTTIVKTISNIPAKKIKFVDFDIAALPTTFGIQQFQVKVEPQPGPTKIVAGTIAVASQPYLNIVQNANLVGSPWRYGSSNWATILGSGADPMQPDIDYQVFAFDADTQQYTIQTTPQRGLGGFIISVADHGFKKLAGSPSQPTDLQSGAPLITLKPGWNLISNPYNYPIPLGQIVGVPGTDKKNTYTYQQLIDNGAIAGSLATWDPVTQSYIYIGTTTDLMQPNAGYWIDVLDPIDLTVSYPPVFLPFIPAGAGGGNTPNLNARETPMAKGVTPLWTSNIVVHQGKVSDRLNQFGFVANAAEAKRGSLYEPPIAPVKTALSAFFKTTSTKRGTSAMSRMLVKNSDAQGFNLNVLAKSSGNITMEWPQVKNIPSKYDVILRDNATGNKLDMRTTAKYSYKATGNILREFKVIVRLHVETILDAVTATKNGVNSPVTIGYHLAIPSDVTIRAYRNGELVATVASGAHQEGGTQQVQWNLKDSNGVRVAPGTYRIQVVATDGDYTESKNASVSVN